MIYSWKLPRGNFSVCQKQLKKIYLSIVDLRCCVSFRCRAKWITYTYIYINFFKILFPYRSWQSIPKAALKGSPVTMNVTDIESLFQSRILQMLCSDQLSLHGKTISGLPLSFKKIWLYCTWDLSSPIRNQTGAPWTGRQRLNRWTTGKAPRAALQEVSAFSLTASPPTWMKTASSTVEPHFALFWSSNLLPTQQPDFQTELFQVNQRQSHSSAQKPPVTSYCSWGGGTFRGKKANFSMHVKSGFKICISRVHITDFSKSKR